MISKERNFFEISVVFCRWEQINSEYYYNESDESARENKSPKIRSLLNEPLISIIELILFSDFHK